jgi:hypothetical protein
MSDDQPVVTPPYVPIHLGLIKGVIDFLQNNIGDHLAACGQQDLPDSAIRSGVATSLPGERISVDFLQMIKSPNGQETMTFCDWDLYLGLEIVAEGGSDVGAQTRALAIEFACRQAFDVDPYMDTLLATGLEYHVIEGILVQKPKSVTCHLGVHLFIPWIRIPKPEYTHD